MKTTRNTDKGYTVTGHTNTNELVQYNVTREGSGWMSIGWTIELVYGNGKQFKKQLFSTKTDAVNAIKNQ
jgi:hypothetical protein